MIPCVESQYTQEYIANVFWRQDIAKVSSITLIPYIKKSEIYSIAYINIAEWCDTEVAFNFIHRLKNEDRECRIIHHNDEWWPVQLNTHNNGEINVGNYTVVFDSTYFKRNIVCPEEKEIDSETESCSEIDDEYFKAYDRPIKGLGNDYYSVDEALGHLWALQDKKRELYSSISSQKNKEYVEIEDEIEHFENELRIHESILNSMNVTIRGARPELFPSEWRHDTVC